MKATTKRPSRTESVKADRVVTRRVKRVSQMTPAEIRARVAELRRQFAEKNPSLAAVESDEFELLMASVAVFVGRYFPAASGANLTISHPYGPGTESSMVMLPVPGPRQQGGSA